MGGRREEGGGDGLGCNGGWQRTSWRCNGFRTAVRRRCLVGFLFLLPCRRRNTGHKASEGRLTCVGIHILRSSCCRPRVARLIGRPSRCQSTKTWLLDLDDLWQAVFDCGQSAANRFEGGWAGEVVSKLAGGRRKYSTQYLSWQGPSSCKLTPVQWRPLLVCPNSRLWCLFRRATPDAFHSRALFPPNPLLQNTDPLLSCHGPRWGWKQSDQAARDDRSTVGSWLVMCLAGFWHLIRSLHLLDRNAGSGTLSLAPPSAGMCHSFISKPWPRVACRTRRACCLHW